MSYGPPPPGGGYEQPAYGVPAKPPRTHPLSVAALVLGIIGVIPCCSGYFLISIAAVVTAIVGRRQIAASGGALKGDGLAKAALVLGVIGILIGATIWILYATGVIDVNTTRT